jgi:hypothetical protein
MTEQELRQLVRGVIAEREVRLNQDTTNVGLPERAWRPPSLSAVALCAEAEAAPAAAVREHASHALFIIPAQGDACIIEPAVTCNHCGYCKSYGH